jgi:predicted molibdopterin-dependent oxidoreductase YjgC
MAKAERLAVDDDVLFSYDLEGHILRVDRPTEDDLAVAQKVTLTVDGKEVTVDAAVYTFDPLGRPVYDQKTGRPVPRRTTILDAVAERYKGRENPVPTLCHREHMDPAAVCRVCLVQETRDAGGRTVTKLVPACYQPIVNGSVVDTLASGSDDYKEPDASGALVASGNKEAGERVRDTVSMLVEMLSADHLHRSAHPANELEKLAERFRISSPRFPRQARYEPHGADGQGKGKEKDREAQPAAVSRDATSPWFVVDRTACILCDRCVRGCNAVRGHNVIARAGKGMQARIAFDWGDPMGESSCVKCGECFISCPTDAITMRPGVKESPWDEYTPEDSRPGPLAWVGRLFGKDKGRPS